MIQLFQGDCLEVMKQMPDKSVDLVLCDLPYGTTQNKWDAVIPFEPLWEQYSRVCKGAVVLTAAQPFTSALVMSNVRDFKYQWVWVKDRKTNSLNAKIMPMSGHEDICVFGWGKLLYNPQMRAREKPISKKTGVFTGKGYGSINSEGYERRTDTICPDTVIYHGVERGLHPTQKPVQLMEYLIKTYTNEGMTVLDNCMGSGTTGVACVNTNRNFIGIEKDPGYFEIAKKRIEEAEESAKLKLDWLEELEGADLAL